MKRITYFLLISICYIGFSTACQEHTYFERDYPRVQTNPVEFPNNNMLLKGEIVFLGDLKVVDHGFVWDVTPNFLADEGKSVSLGAKAQAGEFQYTPNDEFDRGELYYVRAYVKSDLYTVYGIELSFVAK